MGRREHCRYGEEGALYVGGGGSTVGMGRREHCM